MWYRPFDHDVHPERLPGPLPPPVEKDRLGSVLDLPCGHGRILRALKAAFPDAKLSAGIWMIKRSTFAPAHSERYPNVDRGKIRIRAKFKLIWVGSLFTHLSGDEWQDSAQYVAGDFRFPSERKKSLKQIQAGCNSGSRLIRNGSTRA